MRSVTRGWSCRGSCRFTARYFFTWIRCGRVFKKGHLPTILVELKQTFYFTFLYLDFSFVDGFSADWRTRSHVCTRIENVFWIIENLREIRKENLIDWFIVFKITPTKIEESKENLHDRADNRKRLKVQLKTSTSILFQFVDRYRCTSVALPRMKNPFSLKTCRTNKQTAHKSTRQSELPSNPLPCTPFWNFETDDGTLFHRNVTSHSVVPFINSGRKLRTSKKRTWQKAWTCRRKLRWLILSRDVCKVTILSRLPRYSSPSRLGANNSSAMVHRTERSETCPLNFLSRLSLSLYLCLSFSRFLQHSLLTARGPLRRTHNRAAGGQLKELIGEVAKGWLVTKAGTGLFRLHRRLRTRKSETIIGN